MLRNCKNPACGARVVPTKGGICPACRRFDFAIGQVLDSQKIEMLDDVGPSSFLPERIPEVGTIQRAPIAKPPEPLTWSPPSLVTHDGEESTPSDKAPIHSTIRKLPPDRTKACPRCRATEVRHIGFDDSNALDGLSYLQCFGCGALFSDRRWSRGQFFYAAFGLALIAISICLSVWVRFGSLPVMVGLVGLVLSWIGFVSLRSLESSDKPVELLPIDEHRPDNILASEPPPQLQEWIRTCAAQDRPTFRAAKWLTGMLLSGIGGIAVLVAGAFTMPGASTSSNMSPLTEMSPGQYLLAAAGMSIVGLLGMWFSSIGKGLQSAARPAWKSLLKSTKRPVLYLRAFDDDRHALWTGSTIERKFDGRHLNGTAEDAIIEAFDPSGVVVTIGRPGEWVAPSGAARVWLRDDEWQRWVQDFVSWSQRVVMLMGPVGSHAGLAWEVRTIFSTCAPHKIVLLVPPTTSEEKVESMWSGYRKVLGERFPAYRPDVVALRFTSTWNVLIISVDQYRKLPSEDMRKAFVGTLTAIQNWKRPLSGTGFKCKTVVIDCGPAQQTNESGAV